MPLVVVQIVLGLSILLTAASGVWLMINARSVAWLFRKSDAIEPGPSTGRHAHRQPKGMVLAILVAFNIGWIAAVVIWSWSVSEEASALVEARAS